MAISALGAPGARILAKEGRRRLRTTTIARTVALLPILGIVTTVAPRETFAFYYTLISLFAVLGWASYAVSRTRWDGVWRAYGFTAADYALLTYLLIVPAPNALAAFPDVFFLRFDNFDYYYVVLASLSISLRPWLLVWGGVCGAVFWCAGLYWLARSEAVSTIDAGTAADPAAQTLLNAANPYYMDLGVQFQGVAIYLIVAMITAVGVEASLRLAVREASQERRAANLSRYLPVEMIETLADRDAPFGGEREAEAAILFTDVVGFSHMAERAPPHDVIAFLRDIHALVEAEVFAHGGMLDKFIGDGAMATFGAGGTGEAGGGHGADRLPAARAVACARAILDASSKLTAPDGETRAAISVGVHYGLVVIGDVGSARRMELAIIGDTVNVAARLEAMTRRLGVGAAISDEAMAAAGRPNGPRPLGPQPVEGRDEPIAVWALDRSA